MPGNKPAVPNPADMWINEPSPLGVQVSIPIYSSLKSFCVEMNDNKYDAKDLVAGVGMTLDALATAMDPVGAVIGMVLEWGKNLLLKIAGDLAKPLDFLFGSPDKIYTMTQIFIDTGNAVASVGDAYVATLPAPSFWDGPGAFAYRGAARGIREMFVTTSATLNGAAQFFQQVGAVVAAVRETVWTIVRETLVTVIEEIIAAIAASVLTAGAAAPVATAGIFATVAAKVAKIAGKIADLMRKVASFVRKLGAFGEAVISVGKKLLKLAAHLRDGGTSAGDIALVTGQALTAGGSEEVKYSFGTQEQIADAAEQVDEMPEGY